MEEDLCYRQEYSLQGGEFSRAGDVSRRIKDLLKELGLDAQVIRRAAIASFEAEMNVIMYAFRGTVHLAVTPVEVRIVIDDRGPGIPDIGLAMTEGYSTATKEMRELGFGAGMGLPNIKRNADAFRIISEPGTGTRLEMTFARGGRPS